MNNRIKLSETDCQYLINEEEKTVSCKMFYRLKMDNETVGVFTYFFDEYPFNKYPCSLQNVTATARLSEGDTFDVKKGMQVARAKAETKAYKRMRQIMKKLSGKLASMIVVTNDFENRAEDIIKHNDEYLKTF